MGSRTEKGNTKNKQKLLSKTNFVCLKPKTTQGKYGFAMPKRSNQHVAAVAAPTVKEEEDGEKGFSLPVQLTKKQCVRLVC